MKKIEIIGGESKTTIFNDLKVFVADILENTGILLEEETFSRPPLVWYEKNNKSFDLWNKHRVHCLTKLVNWVIEIQILGLFLSSHAWIIIHA